MDSSQIKKIQAMKMHKRRVFLNNLYFYSLSALTCGLFCCVTLCLPYLSFRARVIFFECIPNFVPVIFGSKLLFIVGNLIIVALIVDYRFFSSKSSLTTVVFCDEYIKSSQTHRPQIPSLRAKKTTKLEKHAAEIVDMTGEDGGDLKGKAWVERAVEVSREEENLDDGGEPSPLSASNDDLNERVEDFIARVNRQRRLERSLLQCGTC